MDIEKSSDPKKLNSAADETIVVDPAIFQAALRSTFESLPIRATRRILFNHLDQSIEERGYFHVDHMYGSGSGVVIKHENIFYLLTANHVIANATAYSFTNESPFWIPSQSNSFPSELNAFLMPAQIVHIGETVPDRGKNFDSEDIILIELFFPHADFIPDQFIDLDTYPDDLATEEDFFEGQFLVAAGYPFSQNAFDFFAPTPEGMTHSTYVHRLIVDGICELEDDEPIMTRRHLAGEFPNLSGASGGIVTNVPAPGDRVKVLGMLVSAGSTIVRFIPSYIIAEAIKNKHMGRITAVDPAFAEQPPVELRKMFLDIFGARHLKIPK
jgi:hypothetical protein